MLINGLGQFLLEQHHNLLHVLARHHFQGDAKSLPANINVRAGEHTQDFHGKVIQNTLIPDSQLVDPVQYNELDVVVGLPDGQFDQFARSGLHSHGIAGEGRQRCRSFVDHRTRRRVKQVENQTQVFGLVLVSKSQPCLRLRILPHLILRVLDRILPDKFQLHQLQQLIGIRDAIERRRQVLQGLLVADGHESGKRITLAGAIRFGFEEGLDELWGVRDEVFRVLIDRGNRPHGVLPHVRMTVFQARASGGEQRFDEFWFPEFAQEPQGIAANVFVGMLQVITDSVAGSRKQGASAVTLWLSELNGAMLTTPGSSPASTGHSCPASDRSRSRNTAASSMTCSGTASQSE